MASEGARMEVRTEVTDRAIALAEVAGEVDAYTSVDLEKALESLAAAPHARLAVDFAGVTFLSSSGLRVLLKASRAASSRGCEMRLFGLRPQVVRVFQLAGFDRVLHVVATREEAEEGI